MIKFLLIVLLCSTPVYAVEFPAFAQTSKKRSINPTINIKLELDELKFSYKPKLFIAYSNTKNVDGLFRQYDSLKLKAVCEGKRARYNIGRKKGQLIDEWAKRQDDILSKLEITLINGDDLEEQRKWGLPAIYPYYPLIKYGKHDVWMRFPSSRESCFLYHQSIIEWLEYYYREHLEDFYNSKHEKWPYDTNIDKYRNQKAKIWLFEQEKRAFLFLLNHGVNPNYYQKSYRNKVDKKEYYSNIFYHRVYSYNTREEIRKYNYFIKGGYEERVYSIVVSDYVYFRDHDFGLIKQHFPDFVMPDKYEYANEPFVRRPWWSSTDYNITISDNKFVELEDLRSILK